MIPVNSNSSTMTLMTTLLAIRPTSIFRSILGILSLILFVAMIFPSNTNAQLLGTNDDPALSPNAGFTIAGNVVNATTTGAILGLATMALEDATDYQRPLSVGVGIGMLAGVGLSIYDLASVPPGEPVQQRGLFTSGSNTSLLLLMDTIYGAALGSVVGTAVILVSGDEITDGLQFGAATGAFVGAGFGLFDAFVLDFDKSFAPSGIDDDMPPLVEAWSDGIVIPSRRVSGVTQTFEAQSSLHFLQPSMNSFKSVTVASGSGRGVGAQNVSVGLDLFALRISL